MSVDFPVFRVGVAIINYRTAALVARCLTALDVIRGEIDDLTIVVVDNHSGDDSLKYLHDFVDANHWNDWIHIIAADRNGGFSYGNNIAFRHLLKCGCRYLWMLNPDTVPLPGACKALIDKLEASDTVAMVGSRLQDADGTPQISAFNFPSALGELISGSHLGILERIFPSKRVSPPVKDHAHSTDWLAGASILFRTALLDRIGFMDEAYFLYFEEVDYCLAARRAGYTVWYCPQSRVIHEVGAATGISDERKKAPRRPKYWFDSRRRYFRKNHGYLTAVAADIGWLIGHCSWVLRNTLQRKPSNTPPNFFRDFVRFSLLGLKERSG